MVKKKGGNRFFSRVFWWQRGGNRFLFILGNSCSLDNSWVAMGWQPFFSPRFCFFSRLKKIHIEINAQRPYSLNLTDRAFISKSDSYVKFNSNTKVWISHLNCIMLFICLRAQRDLVHYRIQNEKMRD